MSALEADPLTLIILKAPANEELTGALIGLQDNKRTITVKKTNKGKESKNKTKQDINKNERKQQEKKTNKQTKNC